MVQSVVCFFPTKTNTSDLNGLVVPPNNLVLEIKQ